MKTRKKLIEVALPLDAINKASAREKSIRHGHPSTLHLWWARRPLAAARAVIFAQMVDDPSSVPEEFPTPEAQEQERQRLFRIIEDLVLWENTTNERVLEKARVEIRRSWARECLGAQAGRLRSDAEIKDLLEAGKMPALPGFHDPFAGGGALPLEAQRLGLESYASDLNPVAVLINKAMIEIPPKFAGRPPVNPGSAGVSPALFSRQWRGAQGLAEDVRYYGQWMRDEAEKRIGHLYPKIEITREMVEDPVNPRPDLKPYVGRKLTVIAWLWARTVKSPNPAFANVDVPLASTFMLSTKPGKEAYVEPVILGARASGPHDADETSALPGYRFTVKVGKPKDAAAAKNGTKLARGANFRCVMSGAVINDPYIKTESMAGRMGARLMAIVAEGDRGRVYLAPTPEHEAISGDANPSWKPDEQMNRDTANLVSGRGYGFFTWADLFTPRQLVALTTFSDLVGEAMEKVKADYLGARSSRPHTPFHSRGYLPHWEAGERPQSITFRLYDSLPRELLERWAAELAALPMDQQALERRKRIEAALDAGHGSLWLRDLRLAEVVENALLHFDGERYRLHAWCVMPNHVHVVVTPLHGNSLSSIMHSWKSFTAKECNRLLGREGQFWMEEYYDRMIRDEHHFARAVAYVEQNPVAAGLCGKPEEWRFGSAWEGERAGRPRSQDAIPLRDGGAGATAYAEAVGVYLGLGVDRLADRSSTICGWDIGFTKIRNTFGRQAIPMTWDYAEGNPFSDSTGNFEALLEWVEKFLAESPAAPSGYAMQYDASVQSVSADKLVSTDPPYYDNIGYADLSDFFYVWLRRSLRTVFPDLFATLAVPKAEELVATPYRHGSKEKAETFFLDGMTQAMRRLAEQAHHAFPVTIYYAFKQTESPGARASGPPENEEEGAGEDARAPRSTGWETFLDAVIRAGFAISGTWPMRTELSNRMIGSGTNALASSIILVCRPRAATAPTATRREFVAALKAELPPALRLLQGLGPRASGPHAAGTAAVPGIAPVDLAQAAIGPGMAVYTRYARVLDAEGKPLSVREALALINQTLDEALAEQEGDFDADTRWALTWFEQQGFAEGEYGVAEQLSKAKNTSVAGMVEAGIVESKRGKVRLLKPEELPGSAGVSPAGERSHVVDGGQDGRAPRATVWGMTHHLIRALESGGESAAAEMLRKLGAKAEIARELAYRLYVVSERKKRAAEALAYNGLVQSWPEIARIALAGGQPKPEQAALFGKMEE